MWEGINKRRFPRVNHKCVILIKRRFLPKHIKTYTENIGIGGICVILQQKLKTFTDVKIKIASSNDAPSVECSGKVVWEIKRELPTGKILYDTGIEFTDLKDSDKSQIENIVDMNKESSEKV